MMTDLVLTRQDVTARIAEFYDPAGLMEPIKLQLKLHLARLNGKDWKTPLTPEEQTFWKAIFADFVDFHTFRIPRCVVPPDCGDRDIRLVCFADAAAEACGAVIYAGVEISPGLYTSSLMASRSKLTKATIPRNELTAIMLMTELAYIVKRALGSRVKEVIYRFNDSTVLVLQPGEEAPTVRAE